MRSTATRGGNGESLQAGLGQLLEFAVSASPLAMAVEAYGALGMWDVPVADFVPGARAVVSDGRLCIGLQDDELDGPVPTFVRPGLKEHVRALDAAGVELELVELADDQFHRAGFRDPNGILILMVEARTFPPVEPSPQSVPACGTFAELSVATQSLDASTRFWTSLGFSPIGETDDPHPWRRLEGHGLVVGLHETGRFRAALTFHAPQLDARIEYLRAKGFELRRESPLTGGRAASATLFPPGDVRFYLIDSDE